jgi:choline dehydrogenase-like flavoprotein
MDRPNLTVLTQTQVITVMFAGRRATGVELVHDCNRFRIGAGRELILFLGAINTPKVLMHSGIGDQSALRSFGIPVVQHLPGVGQIQDHAEHWMPVGHPEFPPPRNNAAGRRSHPQTFAVVGTSHYSEMVREARRQRRLVDGKVIDWVVVRNRLSMLGSRNRRRIEAGAHELAGRLGFRFVDGFTERAVFGSSFHAA